MGRISVEEEPEHLFSIFKPLLVERANFKTITIDLSDAEFIYPSALILLIGIREMLGERQISFNFKIRGGGAVHEYLTYCGFGDFFNQLPAFPLNVAKTMQESDVYRLQIGNMLGITNIVAEQLVDLLKKKQILSAKVEADTIDSIDEILRNIKQHSKYSKYILLGQAYSNSRRLRFTIYDNGLGIKEHLTKELYSSRHSIFRQLISEELYKQMKSSPANLAIEVAARYQVSATNYLENSGAGLDFLIRNLSVPTNGIISILSGDGYVQWVQGQKVKSIQVPFKFSGTLVSVAIDCVPGSRLVYKDETI